MISRPIADRKAVLDLDQRALPSASHCQHVADVEAAPGFGMAAQVVLPLVFVVALVEAVGVAAIGQALEFAEQSGVERAAGNGVVDGAAIDLCGARDVVGDLVRPSIFSESTPISTRRRTCSTARRSFEFMM
jgi:hypothetical protein